MRRRNPQRRSMSTYTSLVEEMRKVAQEADERHQSLDPSHLLARLHSLELTVLGLSWVLNAALKKLAEGEA
jgi:hypothetical protein